MTTAPFRTLGVSAPILAAPMAGGPSTPGLVIAAARAGGLGFLAGGYRTAPALGEQIAKVRAAGVSFGVNLFAPSPVPVDPAEFLRYAQLIAGEGEPYGLDLPHAVGGHSGTLTPRNLPADIPLPGLLAQVQAAVPVPLVAAGGIATPDEAAAAVAAGAVAVAVGTVLLCADEAGTTATHRAALSDPAREGTVRTRAFTGRPARALRNRFTDLYSAAAPSGYPALHHLTSPLRKAAAAAGDPERVHLWAGTGYRHATAEPAADILSRLAQHL